MRMLIALCVAALLVPGIGYADATSTAVTVSYSTNTELSCPANASLGGTKCYCNSGYNVSGSTCVKETPAPVAQNEIYDDINVAASLNSELTCAQLGFTNSIDADMCQKFKTNPNGQWKIIQRPSSAPTVVTNPWAQAGQQTLNVNPASLAQSIPAIVTTPPPPPKPTSTPEIIKTPEIVPEEKKPVEMKSKPVVEMPAETVRKPEPPAATTSAITGTPSATSSLEAQVASALKAKNLVAMSSALANLAAANAAMSPPPPPEPTPIPHEDIPIKETDPEPEAPKSAFKKIIDWFFSIF